MADAVHVLVVDDDDVREMLQLLLELEGFRVTAAADGEAGLEAILGGAFGRERPHVVLLDLRMPVMSGWELLDTLRERGRLEALPILIYTSSPEDAPSGFPVMGKPADFDDLVVRLRDLAA